MAKKFKKRLVRKKETLSSRLEHTFELPLGTLTSQSRIEFAGNRRVVVDGCEGIIEYNEDYISLNTESGEIRFNGAELSMNCMTEDSAIIEGEILSMEFMS